MSAQLQVLKSVIQIAWRGCLTDYDHGKINSEHTLQASLWSHLSHTLPSNEYSIFLEQRFLLNKEKVIPDLLICKERTNGDHEGAIVCAIEVKFTPRGRAIKASKDIKTLQMIDSHQGQVEFTHKRHHGRSAKKYKMGGEVLYVWAGIHRKLEHSILELHKVVLNNFIELHPDHDIP